MKANGWWIMSSSTSPSSAAAESVRGGLAATFQSRWRRWLDHRIPLARHVVLDQRRLFIFPGRLGFGYLFTALLLFIAGINYDNSLILNFSFFLGSLFVICILQTFNNLSGLVIDAGNTEPAFAGSSAKFILLLNKSRRKCHHAVALEWHGFQSAAVNLSEEDKVMVEMLLPVERRGIFRPQRLRVTSFYPLGLVRAWSWIALDMESVVYPKPEPCELVAAVEGGAGEGTLIVPEGKDDFDGLRNYQPTDPLSAVDWKAYARTNQLYAKRFHGLQPEARWLGWENVPASHPEMKLSQLCYWVMEYSRRNLVFGLQIPGVRIAPDSGMEHQRRCLEALARF